MAAGVRFGRAIAPLLAVPPPHRAMSSAAASKVSSLKDEDCSGFLPWLRRKAGTDISSVLSVGTSALGRSLFASEPIQEGDCIMEVPYDVQLTQDKLPEEVRMLLDNVVDDTAKIAALLMMEQHLGHVVLPKDFLMYYFEEKGNYWGGGDLPNLWFFPL